MATNTKYRVLLHNRLKGRTEPEYNLIERTGSDHLPTFKYEVQVKGTTLGIGSGPSKDAAKEEAARNAVEHGDKTGYFHRLSRL